MQIWPTKLQRYLTVVQEERSCWQDGVFKYIACVASGLPRRQPENLAIFSNDEEFWRIFAMIGTFLLHQLKIEEEVLLNYNLPGTAL